MEELEKPGSAIKISTYGITDQRMKTLKALGEVIKNLQDALPTVEVKGKELPTAYIDPDIILGYLTNRKEDGSEPVIPDRIIQEATIPIDWLDNVPVANGLPFWERIDCEPQDYYKLFKLYREQKDWKKENEDPDSDELKGLSHRSFEKLTERTGIKESALHSLNKVYHWQWRVKAFDLFTEDTVEIERQRIIKAMNTNHRQAARTVFETCMGYLRDINANGWYDLKGNLQVSPKEMESWMELAVKLERLSVGLPADKPINEEDKVKISKVVTNIKFQQDNKTINLNSGKNGEIGSTKYLQEMIDILASAGALPKEIEAKGDLQENLEKGDEKESV